MASSPDSQCTASVDTPGGALEGLVVDNDENTVLIEFRGPHHPQLPIAEEVMLTLTANDPSVTSEVRARVTTFISRDDAVLYRFRLPVDDAPHLVRLFRRRNAYRARPDPREPVPVLIHTRDERKSNADLFDISMTGMGIVVDPDDESWLFRGEPLRVTFRLPDQAQLFDLIVQIRSRALHGSSIRYGLEFDLEHSMRPALQSERILQYVLARQLDMIRTGRKAS